MGIILNIIYIIVFSFIMYKCFENFDFKISYVVCEGLFIVMYLIAAILAHSTRGFFAYLVMTLIASAVLTFILKKIYEETNSYIGFLITFLVFRVLIAVVW